MRPLAIVSLLAVLLAGLALTPSASAAPPQPACNGTWATTQTVGPVTVFASPPCYEVTIDAMSCPVSPKETTTVRVGQVAVHVVTCAAVESAAMAPPCTCPPPPRCTPVDTVGFVAQVVRVSIDDSCNVRVDLLTAVACTSPFDERNVVTQGRITVTAPCEPKVDPCEPPLECYPTSAAAIELPVCGPDMMCTEPSLGLCDSRDLCNDAGCPYPVGAERGTNLWVGPYLVHHDCGPQDLCSGPLRCTNPLDSAAAVMIPPVCIQPQVERGPVRAGVDQCRQDHETYPSCSSAQRIHRYEEVASGLAWAQVDVCLPHMPPPSTASAAAVELPNPCGPDAYCTSPECPQRTIASDVDHYNGLTVNSDCTVDIVTGYGQICVGAWSGHQQHVLGPITWDRYYCAFPGGTPDLLELSASTGPCGAADPMQRCPAPYPIRPCENVPVAAAATAVALPAGVTYTLSDSCELDVYVKVDVMDCLWGEGYNKTFEQGPVTVWTWGCRPPYPPVE